MHFCVLNSSHHDFAHFESASRSALMAMGHCGSWTGPIILESSTYKQILFSMIEGTLLMKILNKVGPKAIPWGNLLFTSEDS